MTFKKELSANFIFIGLLAIAIGLPVSKSAMSIGQMLLATGWLLEGNFSERLKKFFQNRVALAAICYFVFLLIGLTFTTDFVYAEESIRTKLPLFLIPLFLASTEPIDEKKIRIILWVFILSVFSGSLISMMVLGGIIQKNVSDIRNISIFISHIRFALMIAFSIFILSYFLFKEFKQNSSVKNSLCGSLIFWFLVFLVILESVTGIAVLIIVSLILFAIFVFRFKNKTLRFGILFLLVSIPVSIIFYLTHEIKNLEKVRQIDMNSIQHFTPRGNLYDHRPDYKEYENGNPVMMYVSRIELKTEWEKRSLIPFDGMDEKGQYVEYTLMRFLTSKGLRKDADGVSALSDEEIMWIENGVVNVNYTGITNFPARIKQILWELKSFRDGGNPSGHSVAQRIEFWKASAGIIKENLLLGVGTGNVMTEFNTYYTKINSPLITEKRLKSHNQYLLAGVTLGITGILVFLFSILFPVFFANNYRNYFYFVFMMIVLLSMLTEDTLETQAGVTFFAFFNSLFLFRKRN